MGVEIVQNPLFGIVLFNLLIVWPLWRIFRRAGLQPAWALLVFVPLIGVTAALAVLGHSRWPVLPEPAAPRPVKPRRTL